MNWGSEEGELHRNISLFIFQNEDYLIIIETWKQATEKNVIVGWESILFVTNEDRGKANSADDIWAESNIINRFTMII